MELTLSVGRLQVLGIYTFGNPAPRLWRGRIGYPILVDARQLAPQRIVLDKGDELAVRCRTQERCAAVIPLGLPPSRSRTVRLRYEQRLTGRRATYLLTSARRWKRPLRRADFVIRVPAAWKGVELSYPPEQDTVQGSLRILRFSRRDFVPAKELVVTWAR